MHSLNVGLLYWVEYVEMYVGWFNFCQVNFSIQLFQSCGFSVQVPFWSRSSEADFILILFAEKSSDLTVKVLKMEVRIQINFQMFYNHKLCQLCSYFRFMRFRIVAQNDSRLSGTSTKNCVLRSRFDILMTGKAKTTGYGIPPYST